MGKLIHAAHYQKCFQTAGEAQQPGMTARRTPTTTPSLRCWATGPLESCLRFNMTLTSSLRPLKAYTGSPTRTLSVVPPPQTHTQAHTPTPPLPHTHTHLLKQSRWVLQVGRRSHHVHHGGGGSRGTIQLPNSSHPSHPRNHCTTSE